MVVHFPENDSDASAWKSEWIQYDYNHNQSLTIDSKYLCSIGSVHISIVDYWWRGLAFHLQLPVATMIFIVQWTRKSVMSMTWPGGNPSVFLDLASKMDSKISSFRSIGRETTTTRWKM